MMRYSIIVVFFAGIGLIGVSHAEEMAPHYVVTNLDNQQASLEDLHGDVVMLNSWATWCGPCKEEMPALQKLSNEFSSQGLHVVGVSVDSLDKKNEISSYTEKFGIEYTIWFDPEDRFTSTFKSFGVPHTILIDRDGTIIHEWQGQFDPLSQETKNLVNSVLTNDEFIQITDRQAIGLAIAFSAGLLSFLSPCVLPLIPAYTSLITGLSTRDQVTGNNKNQHVMKSRVVQRGSLFVIGFSIVFITLGTSVALIGSTLLDATFWIEKIGGVVIILFGLNLLGVLRIPRLERQLKINFDSKTKNSGMFFFGITFGAAWTPCIGPILAGILAIAATSSTMLEGALLLGTYSAGLGIPFIISALTIDGFLRFFKIIQSKLLLIERLSGLLLIAIGVLLISGYFTILSSLFGEVFPFESTLLPNESQSIDT